jgi:hypothetical protein
LNDTTATSNNFVASQFRFYATYLKQAKMVLLDNVVLKIDQDKLINWLDLTFLLLVRLLVCSMRQCTSAMFLGYF